MESCLKSALEKARLPSLSSFFSGLSGTPKPKKEKQTKQLLVLLTVRAALRPRSRGYRTSAHLNRDGSGAMSAYASTDARGWDPCGIHTCGSLPRMQSIAADCAPMTRILHHFRVYASAAERRSSGWRVSSVEWTRRRRCRGVPTRRRLGPRATSCSGSGRRYSPTGAERRNPGTTETDNCVGSGKRFVCVATIRNPSWLQFGNRL